MPSDPAEANFKKEIFIDDNMAASQCEQVIGDTGDHSFIKEQIKVG